MNIETEIYNALIQKAGSASKVKGLTATSLRNLKLGKSGISTRKLKEVFELNNLEATFIIKYENTITTVKL